MVMTLPKGENIESFVRRSAEKLKEYPNGKLLDYIRPMTMRLACLFGWARRVAPGTFEMLPVPDTEHQRGYLHPLSPLPLFVFQSAKPSDGEKLAWILQEPPAERGDDFIYVFCKKFLELFGHSFSTKTAQQTTARRLYGHHVGRQLEKGVQM